jgi:hypothetical protein
MEWRSKLSLIARWGRINSSFFLFAFLVIGLLSWLFPNAMLSVFGKWAALLESFGAKSADQLTSSSQMFLHILQRNYIAAIIYFIIGMLLQAPLAMLFSGAFYGFIVFLAPLTIGRSFGVLDWFLVTVEVFALIASASLSSGFAGELYQVTPTTRDWWSYSKKSWRSLSMKVPISWKNLLPSWTLVLIGSILAVAGLILFVAWFETYGY